MNNIINFKEKKLFLFDMDGTIYLDNDLFDETKPLLDYIKSNGGKYIFLTNNSSRGVDKYIEKLSGMGIKTNEDDYVTSVDATVLYLMQKGYKKIYCFGTKSFKNHLEKCGLTVTDKISDDIDCLCMGYDTELTFKKLDDACILLNNKGIDFIATNPDLVCPTWYGYVPDCGSVSEMLFNATKRQPVFIGKPQPKMLNLAMEKTGYAAFQTVVIGDRLYTDIKSGNNAGVDSIFVLSGEGTMEDLKTSDAKPTAVLSGVDEILIEMKRQYNI